MILLTPAVLHSSALERIKEESPIFHRKYVFQFALLQGLWAMILFMLCVATILIPTASTFQTMGAKVLTNANFSKLEIKNGQVSIDVKPAIWVYSLNDSNTEQTVLAVDSLGSMNKYYWDDRVEKGVVKRINGVAVMKDHLFIKNGLMMKKIPYTSIGLGNTGISMTKNQVYEGLLKITNNKTILKYSLIALPLVFILAALSGAFFHVLFIGVVGLTIGFISKRKGKDLIPAFKVSSALYVVWAYLVVLSMIAQKMVLLTLADISNFFMVVRIVFLVVMIFIGYLSLLPSTDGQTSPVTSKVVRKKK